uniref:Uncharacterized protein n=1 Tax=Rhizophora mucronata TaxID=61149 RepID=A0A2P2P4V7_RHIMU
MLASEGLLFSH